MCDNAGELNCSRKGGPGRRRRRDCCRLLLYRDGHRRRSLRLLICSWIQLKYKRIAQNTKQQTITMFKKNVRESSRMNEFTVIILARATRKASILTSDLGHLGFGFSLAKLYSCVRYFILFLKKEQIKMNLF